MRPVLCGYGPPQLQKMFYFHHSESLSTDLETTASLSDYFDANADNLQWPSAFLPIKSPARSGPPSVKNPGVGSQVRTVLALIHRWMQTDAD